MTPKPCFVPLSIHLRLIARQNERDVCCRYGAVHAFVAHWLEAAEVRLSSEGAEPGRITEEIAAEASAMIAAAAERPCAA